MMEVLDRTIHNDDDDFETLSSTEDAYRGFYLAFEWFNAMLFDNKLPDAMITMQRSKRSRGYFSGERFGHRRGTEVVDEIALNGGAPSSIAATRTSSQPWRYEMTHEWQHDFGKPGRRGYHNKEWAAKMRKVGLMPSHTGEPGGQMRNRSPTTSSKVDLTIQTGRPQASGFTLDYQDRQEDTACGRKLTKLKVCYACPAVFNPCVG